jgi:hypothetical protein
MKIFSKVDTKVKESSPTLINDVKLSKPCSLRIFSLLTVKEIKL